MAHHTHAPPVTITREMTKPFLETLIQFVGGAYRSMMVLFIGGETIYVLYHHRASYPHTNPPSYTSCFVLCLCAVASSVADGFIACAIIRKRDDNNHNGAQMVGDVTR